VPIVVRRAGDEHEISQPEEKLRARGALPGAHVYDQATHAMRVLQAGGADAAVLLPVAFSGSWLVNARASSRAFRAWLAPDALLEWARVLDTTENIGPDGWLALGAEAKEACSVAIERLASVGNAASLAAVSKVLALLRPQIAPLMDDAAIAFALGTIAEPETADDPKAPASCFVPMMDWFAREVGANEPALVALAAGHRSATLDAAQVLDRLLWVESWGYRVLGGSMSRPGTAGAP
jgi:hypothetical protein